MFEVRFSTESQLLQQLDGALTLDEKRKMTDNSSDVSEWFNLLESNKAKDVDEIKKIFHEQFLSRECLLALFGMIVSMQK